VSYSCVEGGPGGPGVVGFVTDGGGNIGVSGDDPCFVRAPYPGADGTWDGVDDDYGDLRLGAGSDCIDAGSNAAAVAAGLVTDLSGDDRFVNDPATPDTGEGSAPVVDMGAYEYQAP
jgi:hypothetical protein